MTSLFWRRFSLPLSVIALLAISGSQSAVSVPTKPSVSEYHDTWRKLWEDHISWTRSVIIAVFDLPQAATDAYVPRLLKNYEDMEDALRPYYGDDADVLGDLISDHLTIAYTLLVAARDNGLQSPQVTAASEAWYANGHDIAVKMSEMNPTYWPLSVGDPMWKAHLDATLDEAVKHATGHFAEEVVTYDMVHDMAIDMADFFSNGVAHQFPGRFNRRP